jgi:hypothetical protein
MFAFLSRRSRRRRWKIRGLAIADKLDVLINTLSA